MREHPRNVRVRLTEPEAVWLLTSGLVNWDKEEPTARSAHDHLRRAMERAHQCCTCGPEEKCSACPTREDALDDLLTDAFDALLWISEAPDRSEIDGPALALAEHARSACVRIERRDPDKEWTGP